MPEMENVQMETDGIYRTSDFYIAAWLLSKGFQLQGIDRSNKRRNNFIFIDGEDRPQLVHYNFFRPHSAVGNKTPAEAAGADAPFKSWADVVKGGNK